MENKVKFVQIACSDTDDSDSYRTIALDSDGNVWSHYEHTTHGWGWYRLRGDNRRADRSVDKS